MEAKVQCKAHVAADKNYYKLETCYLPGLLFDVLEAFFSFSQHNNCNKLGSFMTSIS